MFACFDVLQICIMQNIDNTNFLHLWSHAGSNNYILFGGFRLRSHKRSNLLDSPLEISWNGVCDREASLEILKAKLDDISWNRVGMLLHICRWYVIWVYQATSCNRCKGLLTTLYQHSGSSKVNFVHLFSPNNNFDISASTLATMSSSKSIV